MAAQDTARRVRAIWGYSLLPQKRLASEAGIHPDRLRAIIGRTDPKEASPDELLRLAQAAKIPASFAAVGFESYGQASEIDKLWNEIGALRQMLSRQLAAAPRPQPPGMLGHAIGAGQTTTQDQEQTETPKGEDTRRGTGG